MADQVQVKLDCEALGGTIAAEIGGAGEQREMLITWALLHCIARKADQFVATAMDLDPAHRHAEQTEAVVDKCAMLVHTLDGVVGNAEPRTCLEALKGVLPAFYYLVGCTKSPKLTARHREWRQLENMTKLLERRLLHPEANGCTTCLTPLEAGHCITCAHRAAKRA